MKILDRILKKIIRRYLSFIIKETENLKERKSQNLFNSIKIKGTDSLFWGKNLTISDPSKIEIGQNVHIGNNAYIKSEGGLVIGDNTHISRNLLLYTVNHNSNADVLPYNDEIISKKVIIGENVWIGMNVCITPGTVIGDGCIIGMGTVVSGKVPALSIIGSEKWRIIGKRDEQRYAEIMKRKRFGKENGLLYKSGNKLLSERGEFYTNQRTYIEVIDFDAKKAIKKSWENNKVAIEAFKNEVNIYSRFTKYSWLPEVYEVGENYFILEYFDNNFRLDKLDISNRNSKERNKILGDILTCLLDIHTEGIAHCDIHAKNIFITSNGIKIIDFETAQNFETEVRFFESYDIMGKGLVSPYQTNNACVLSEGKHSLKNVFNIKDVCDLKKVFHEYLIEELYVISNSFFTRKTNVDGRHILKNRFIYSTFDLEFLEVKKDIGQRDIKKRLSKYDIQTSDIKNKNILDIGSNIGAVLFEIMKMNPKTALGIEYDMDKIRISNTIKNLHYKDRDLKFEQFDIESSSFLSRFDLGYEVVFCLAVIEHLKDKNGFLELLGKLCLETLYFEGNSGTDTQFIVTGLKNAGFSSVKYIGNSNDEKDKRNNTRPLFIAKK